MNHRIGLALALICCGCLVRSTPAAYVEPVGPPHGSINESKMNGGAYAGGYSADGYSANGYAANGHSANGYSANGYSANSVSGDGYGGDGYGGDRYGGDRYEATRYEATRDGGDGYRATRYSETSSVNTAGAVAGHGAATSTTAGGTTIAVSGVTASGGVYGYGSATSSTAGGSTVATSGAVLGSEHATITSVTTSTNLNVAQLAIARTFLQSITKDHHLYSSLLRFVNDPSGRASMLAGASDGGFFVAAARRAPTPRNEYAKVATVYRLDGAGAVRWTADVGDRGFATYELMSVIATPDGGAIAQVLAYRHPARNPNQRFVKLDRDGRRVWALQLPGTGDTDSPQAEVVRSDGRGGVEIHGYWVRSSELADRNDWRGHMRDWQGTISADGTLVRNDIGAVLTIERIGTWPEQDPMWNSVTGP